MNQHDTDDPPVVAKLQHFDQLWKSAIQIPILLLYSSDLFESQGNMLNILDLLPCHLNRRAVIIFHAQTMGTEMRVNFN